jgi:hypothetical protein
MEISFSKKIQTYWIKLFKIIKLNHQILLKLYQLNIKIKEIAIKRVISLLLTQKSIQY